MRSAKERRLENFMFGIKVSLPNNDLKFEGCCVIYDKGLYKCTVTPMHIPLHQASLYTCHITDSKLQITDSQRVLTNLQNY